MSRIKAANRKSASAALQSAHKALRVNGGEFVSQLMTTEIKGPLCHTWQVFYFDVSLKQTIYIKVNTINV